MEKYFWNNERVWYNMNMGKILTKKNIGFIDGQNLYYGTRKCKTCSENKKIELIDIKLSDCDCGYAFEIDLSKMRIYLKEKYHIDEIYYYFGHLDEDKNNLYTEIQKAGYIVIFKEHNNNQHSKKKGNVDTDIVFEIMKNLIDNEELDKILLVSSDGDYKKLVDYLINKDKFIKILFPSRQASSLYKKLGDNKYFGYLHNIRHIIEK